MRKLLKNTLSFLNIHPDENQKWVLLTMFVSGIMVTYALPTIRKEVVTNLPAEWIAFESLFGALSGLLIGMLWKGTVREKAVQMFSIFAITESVVSFSMSLFLCFVYYNVWIFAIVSLLYTSFITVFIGKCIMVFKTKLWNEKEREMYDNNNSIVLEIVCILGYGTALVAMPSLNVALFLWGLCCVIDDIGWIFLYKKNQKILSSL